MPERQACLSQPFGAGPVAETTTFAIDGHRSGRPLRDPAALVFSSTTTLITVNWPILRAGGEHELSPPPMQVRVEARTTRRTWGNGWCGARRCPAARLSEVLGLGQRAALRSAAGGVCARPVTSAKAACCFHGGRQPHPAYIPHEGAGGPRQLPAIPARRRAKGLLSPVIPGCSGSTRKAEESFASRRSPVRSRHAPLIGNSTFCRAFVRPGLTADNSGASAVRADLSIRVGWSRVRSVEIELSTGVR